MNAPSRNILCLGLLVSLLGPVHTLAAPTSFTTLQKRAASSPRYKHVQFWQRVGKLIEDSERRSERTRSASFDLFSIFISSAYADGLIWCTNNGFIAQVPTCNKENNWAFNIREIPDFQSLLEANVDASCPSGSQPCSLIGGLTSSGELQCSPDKTSVCLQKGQDGGIERLVDVLNACSGNAASVEVGSRTIRCAPLLKAIEAQMASLDANCSLALPAVRNVCDQSKSALEQILQNQNGLTSPITQSTQNTAAPLGANVLFVGDSHSTGCFGTALQEDLEDNGAHVRRIATCGSGTRNWLRQSHSSTCGFRDCETGRSCRETGAAASLESLLTQTRPQTTVIALGSNMAKGTWSQTESEVARLVAQVQSSGSQCLWIGPPEAQAKFMSNSSYNNYVDRLGAAVSSRGCHFVDSRASTNSSDISDSMGIHYGCNDSTSWAHSTFRSIQGSTPTSGPQTPALPTSGQDTAR